MAYDEALAERVRDVLALREDVKERKMFGGIDWMIGGNMACGILGEDLIVRLGDEESERALAEPHTRPFDFTGQPMKRTIFVAPEGIAADQDLADWVDAGADYAVSLPPR